MKKLELRPTSKLKPSKLFSNPRDDLRARFDDFALSERKSAPVFEKVVLLNRVSKVVKGGRKYRYSALVVVGDISGRVGTANAKASDAQDAATKASQRALSALTFIPLTCARAVPFKVKGVYNNTRALVSNSRRGGGNSASNVAKAVLDALGMKDVTVKLTGSRNPHNVVKAVLNALSVLSNYYRLWS
ncbi:30S ribosomal protein S5 [Candidatus Hodgkinia cicadicola]